jgi:exopolysaccharide biosynthesis polyprenyl glycosylphosphotransferase
MFVFFLWSIFIVISFKRRKLYATNRGLSIPKELFRVIISILYTGILISTVIFFAQYKFFSRMVFLVSLGLLCMLLSAWRIIKRLILRRLLRKGFHNIRILIAGAGKIGKIVLEEVIKNPWLGFKVVGFLDDVKNGAIDNVPIVGKLKDFPVIVKKLFIDELVITIPSEKQAVSELIRQAKSLLLGVRVVPENFEEPVPTLDISYLGIMPLLTYKERKHHPAEFIFKRLFDFIISLTLLLVLSPSFFIISLLIKLDSEGRIFYIQKRIGLKGKIFNFYKFRSMIKDADKLKPQLLERNEVKDGVIFKIKEDPRITPIGRLIRRYSLDELPQLFNVLKGDMSLVGPRPPTSDEVDKYNHLHMDRLSIKPGITGLAQIKGRSELTFRKWVKWDLWYINNWSFGLDLAILWWTVPTVIKGKGAY